MLEIGQGELGLKPWEFDQYTLDDFVTSVKGYRTAKMDSWYQTRMLAFSIVRPHLKNQNMTIDKFWPFPGDRGYGNKKGGLAETLRGMTRDEQREHMKKIAERANQAFTKVDQERKEDAGK